jgi:CHASE2 domain-containing sensor protein
VRRDLGETARNWWRRHWRDLAWTWVVGLAVSVAVTLASFWGYVVPGETQILDLLQRLQRDRDAPEVVIVAVDEASFQAVGARQPVSRRHLASVLRGLQRSGAAVVGLDIILDTPTTDDDDAALARAIVDFADGGTSRVVVATIPSLAPPFATPEFRAVVPGGSPDGPRDADDHIVRNVQLLLARTDEAGRTSFEPAFSLVVADRVLGPERDRLARVVEAGAGPLPLARWQPDRQDFTADAPPLEVSGAETRRINFVGRRGSFATVPSHVVAAAGESEAHVAEDNPFRGRIVLVGETFTASRDNQPTPYGAMDGVEIHANVVHMLLTRTILVPHHWARALALQALFVTGAGLVLVLLPGKLGKVVCFLGAVLLSVPASYRAFERGGHVLSFVLPVFAEGYMRKYKGARQGDLVRRTAERIGLGAPTRPAVPRPSGAARDVSVLVADVVGATDHLASLPDGEASRFLEEFAGAMRDPILARGGSFEGPIGERTVAVFDAADHVQAAVRAALELRAALHRLAERWGGPEPGSRGALVCVATGAIRETGAGVGPRALLGEPLSVASRCEGGQAAKEMTVLVTEETFKRLARRLRVRDYPDRGVDAPAAVRLFEVEAFESEGDSPG